MVTSNQPLSKREQEITQLAAHGLRSTEIANQLGISPRTAQHTLERARDKSGALNVAHHVAIALSRGWIRPLVVLLVVASITEYHGTELRVRSAPRSPRMDVVAKRRSCSRNSPFAVVACQEVAA